MDWLNIIHFPSYVCTGDGALLRFSHPEMKLVQRLQLFTLREHVNTLAVLDDVSVWAVLHNLGQVSCSVWWLLLPFADCSAND